MKTFNNIFILLFLFTFSIEAIAQNSLSQKLNKINTYHNSIYGFNIQYPGELKERTTDEIVIQLSQVDASQSQQSQVNISVDKKSFVDLPGTYGGRYYFSDNPNSNLMSDRYAVEQDTLNGLIFAKEYWVVYGGMGGWETIINCYTQHQGQYYIISLVHKFISGTPGEIIDDKKIMQQELINEALQTMRDTNNYYVNAFTNILSSFTISK